MFYILYVIIIDIGWLVRCLSEWKDEKILNKCKEIGNKVHKSIPKLVFKGKKTDPVMTRVDMVCCLDNKPQSSLKYYLNEKSKLK